MVDRSETPGAIEGDEVLITGQNILTSRRPQRIRDTDTVVYCIDVKERGKAIIMKRCPEEHPPIRDYSMLNEADSISGKLLTGLITFPLAPGDIRVGGAGRTGAHPGQELYVGGGCFMEIVSGWRGTPLSVHPKDALLT